LAIFLAGIKLEDNDIREAILSLDDEILSLETLKSLRHYSPTSEEIEAIKSFRGDRGTLSTADQYIIKVMDIPRLQHRLTAMIYRRRFEHEIDELGPELGVLRRATIEIKSSSKLKKIMLYVLEFGNILNSSTFRGNATGFEISALSKLRETRSNSKGEGRNSLIHYLAKYLKKFEDECISLDDELAHLDSASR
ncbi:hypothetical protein DFH28DRAFT_846931, partial [Melampsora americana]